MPIDSSIYQRQMPNFLGAVKDGMGIRDLADQRVERQRALQEQEKIKAAYQAGVVTKDDGSTSIDPQRQMSALLKVSPQEAQKFQMQQDQMRGAALDRKAKEATIVSQAFGSVNDLIDSGDMANAEKMWHSVNQQLQKDGVDLGQFANAPFDPKLAKSLYAGALTKRDRLDEAFRRDQLAVQKQEAATKAAEARAKVYEAGGGGGGGVPKKLSGDDRKRLDNIVMGKRALMQMADALKNGDNTFSLVGDNDFTLSRTQWEEAIGRMQSGGAINEEEASRFRSMIPRATDSSAIQKKKLNQMAVEMDQRLGTFGIKQEKMPGYKIGMPFSDADQAPKTFKTSEVEWAD